MIKKITIALIICYLMTSCGKKGDPEYKDSQKKVSKTSMKINNA